MLNEKCTTLLHRAVKMTGTYDPEESMPYIEEDLTQGEYETCSNFLLWCHQNHQTFGWGNINPQFAKYRDDVIRKRWIVQ